MEQELGELLEYLYFCVDWESRAAKGFGRFNDDDEDQWNRVFEILDALDKREHKTYQWQIVQARTAADLPVFESAT